MIQEELRNFIEQNCSGKEPSDLIMEAIGQKIEQLGADADEVLAYVEECVKGPTLEEKTGSDTETMTVLKSILHNYIKNIVIDGDQLTTHRGEKIPVEQYKLHPHFYRDVSVRGDGFALVFHQIEAVKAEAALYRKYEEIDTLINKVRKKEASVYYEGAVSRNGRVTRKAEKFLTILKEDYSDIAPQYIVELEEKIAQAKQQKEAEKAESVDQESRCADDNVIKREWQKIETERKKIDEERRTLEAERRKLYKEREEFETERKKFEEITQKAKEENSLSKKFSKLFGK
jgi:hypothetical protein